MTIHYQPTALPKMTTPLTFAMAVGAGAAVANIYYNQPMLELIGKDLPLAATLISPVTQLGYALGLFLLVPLGDIVERKRLIVGQFLTLALALLGVAYAGNTALIVIFSALVGISSTVAQQIIPFAVHLTTPSKRGATVGTLLSGVLGGILLSRTVAGYIGTHLGWREMYMIAVAVALVGALGMWAILPSLPTSASMRYRTLISSIGSLWMKHRELRRAAVTQALIFAGFSAFWTALPFRLAQPDLGLGAEIAGLFGIVGAVGVIAAPVAGRVADVRGPAIVVRLGAIIALASWALFAASPTIAGLVIGVIALDFGMQSALVSNQSLVYALDPSARARLNTVLMGSMFLGGAIGSAVAIAVWSSAGWLGVTALGGLVSAIAVALQVRRRPE
ncbi:putative MFS family arabinose efflux permease [Neorhizobium galegae]|uniref:MFS transporter n=1 Tax=Neorhizobium galegae TaxID=399 RepID=UPI001AE11869|nr:MFS transporter [Neorhizobium galegae]MBP2551782.1 putative MFS family arabinose efflux permease [Neorhizobium galegae]